MINKEELRIGDWYEVRDRIASEPIFFAMYIGRSGNEYAFVLYYYDNITHTCGEITSIEYYEEPSEIGWGDLRKIDPPSWMKSAGTQDDMDKALRERVATKVIETNTYQPGTMMEMLNEIATAICTPTSRPSSVL